MREDHTGQLHRSCQFLQPYLLLKSGLSRTGCNHMPRARCSHMPKTVNTVDMLAGLDLCCATSITCYVVTMATILAMCGGDKHNWPASGLHHRHIESSLHLVCNGCTYGAGHVTAICRKACKIVAIPPPNWHLAPKWFRDESTARQAAELALVHCMVLARYTLAHTLMFWFNHNLECQCRGVICAACMTIDMM